MTTDETMTPTGEKETQAPVVDTAGQASDQTVAAMQPQDEPVASADFAAEAPTSLEPAAAPEPAAEQTPEPSEPTATEQPDSQPQAAEQPASELPKTAVAATPEAANEEVVSESREEQAMLFEAAMREMETGESTEAFEGSFKKLSRGDRIEATVIQVDKDRVFVDLGTKSEGIVPLNELSEDNLETAKGHFNIGDKINVVVIRPESADGNPIVSKKRADFEEAWDRIEEAHKTQEMITAQVVDRVKGGLVVDVGVRGFVPATHVGNGKLRNIEKYVGNPLQLKVIEIDRDRKKVVLSNREAEEQRRVSAKEEIFKNVAPGEILEGTVRRLTDYGAFVDLGGVDGLLHISEMSWARINHPKEMFKEGQKIKVMVLRLDAGAGKISLGHRQVLPDPWNLIKQNYKVGQNLTVNISRLVQSGAFIRLPEGAEAFLPISEMSFRRIKRPQDVVDENQEVEVQIIDLRTEERRMVLSMRAAGSADKGEAGVGFTRREPGAPAPSFEDEMRGGGDKRGKKKGKKGGRGRDFDDDFDDVGGRRGFATGGATIGERLGMLKGFLRTEDEDEEVTETAATEEEATDEE
jgi:predicted RNA-binding protein with RPS1 domain